MGPVEDHNLVPAGAVAGHRIRVNKGPFPTRDETYVISAVVGRRRGLLGLTIAVIWLIILLLALVLLARISTVLMLLRWRVLLLRRWMMRWGLMMMLLVMRRWTKKLKTAISFNRVPKFNSDQSFTDGYPWFCGGG